MKRHVYITTCLDDLPAAQAAKTMIVAAGHVVTSDWIIDVDQVVEPTFDPVLWGMANMSDLAYADAVLFLNTSDKNSYFELGAAFERGLSIIAVGDVSQAPATLRHPIITWVPTVEDAVAMWR